MSSLVLGDLINDLKSLIIEECEKGDDISPEEWGNDEPLFGNDSSLDLDSLDALQISMAIKKGYGVRIEGANEVRKVMQSVTVLAKYIIAGQASNDG